MFQPLLAIFREPFIYYKNIKLLCYNVVSTCPGLIILIYIKHINITKKCTENNTFIQFPSKKKERKKEKKENFGQKLEYATLVDVTRADTGRVPQNVPSRFLPNPTQFM
jgi:hypothetical protein